MKDFKLDMQVYDYKNDRHEIYDKFSKLKQNQLCFIQDLSMYSEDGKHKFGWNDLSLEVSSEVSTENVTSSDIEEVIKECFDHFGVKYDYVKVELL